MNLAHEMARTGLRQDQVIRNERDRRIIVQRMELERRQNVRRACEQWSAK